MFLHVEFLQLKSFKLNCGFSFWLNWIVDEFYFCVHIQYSEVDSSWLNKVRFSCVLFMERWPIIPSWLVITVDILLTFWAPAPRQ